MKINLSNQPFNVRLVVTLFSLVIIGFLLVEGKRIFSPLAFAALFSILLLPLAGFLERKCRLSRNIAALLAVLTMLLFIGGIFYFLGAQIARLVGDWPMFKEQLGNATDSLQNWVAQRFHIDVAKQTSYVHKATSKIVDSGTGVAGATLYSVSSALLFIGFTVLYTFFFLLYRGLILDFFIKVFSAKNSHLVYEVAEEVQYIIRKYIIGMLIEMMVVSSVVSVAFTLLGIKYAIMLGLIAGLFNVIPYIGILTALIISSLITFATTAAVSKVVWIIAVLFVTHVTDVNILLPLIVGSKVRINAMVTFFGIVAGEMLWGIAGMFLSIPVIAVIKIVFDRVESLQPWGFLMGEEDSASKPLLKKLRGKRSSLEEKMAARESAGTE